MALGGLADLPDLGFPFVKGSVPRAWLARVQALKCRWQSPAWGLLGREVGSCPQAGADWAGAGACPRGWALPSVFPENTAKDALSSVFFSRRQAEGRERKGIGSLTLHSDPCVDGLAGLSLGGPRGSQKGGLSMGVGSRLPHQALLMLDLGPGFDIISSHLLKVGKLMTQGGETFCLKYSNDSGAQNPAKQKGIQATRGSPA